MKITILSKLEHLFNDLLEKVTRPVNLNGLRFNKKTIIPVTSPIEVNDGKTEQKSLSRNKSRLDSQGVPGFSGSSYNGKGRVDNGKIRSNKKRR